MNEWKRFQLDEVAQIGMGQSPDSTSYNEDERGYPFLQGCAEFGATYPSVVYHCDRPTRIAPRGSILISVRAPVGSLNRANADYCIGRGLGYISQKSADIDYLFYVLLTKRPDLERVSQGSTFEAINSHELRSLSMDLPPLPEQRKIASILTTVDNLIEQTEALIEKYKSIKQGMMHDLFTRGVDQSGQLRSSYEEAPHLYKESPLGWIPKEWEVDSVHNVSLQVTDGDHHTPRRSTEGVLLLSARNVRDGYLALKNVDYVDETEYSRMIKRCHPESGDILISCSGTIGKICAVPSNFRCCLVRSAALVKLDRQVIDTRFGEWSFRTSIVQRQIAATQLQAAQPNLFQGGIRSLLLIIPSISEQQFIALRLDALEHGIQAEQKQGAALRTIKTGLMQDLLTGKVRVNVDEAEQSNYPTQSACDGIGP